jgi:hypothetical protein
VRSSSWLTPAREVEFGPERYLTPPSLFD